MRQTSFAAGELSPLLWGRTDLELWRHGARRLQNFIINQQGNAVSRPGTLLAWAAKLPDVVLLPFLHASGESYVLEFGHLYARIYDARTLAFSAELVTPFQTQDLPELQWAQVGSVLVLTHYRRPAQELRIEAVASIVPVRFAPPGDTAGAPPLEAAFPSIGGNDPSMPVLVAWQPTSLFVVDAAHPPREWRYKVSTLLRHNVTGEVVESLPRDITQYVPGNVATGTVLGVSPINLPADNMLVLYNDAPIYIEPGLGAAVTPPANWTPIENLYYRGRGTLFGFVGRCATNARFADFGAEPDYETPPLRGDSPFKAGEYPAAVAFFQQRRAFAGPGQSWWASAVDDWTNHDEPVINWPGQPLAATLVNRKRERMLSMAALEHLLIFTDTSVWCVGRPEVPLDFDTFPAVTRVIEEVGAHPLQPLVIDGAVLYSRAQGRGVRALAVGQSGGFEGTDVSWHAEHLFRGGGQTPTASWVSARIVSWCFQREPFHTVWAVRSDGALLSCTRTGSGTWAWSRHLTGSPDKVLSVTAVPRNELAGGLGGWEDVFIAVRRNGVTCIERMTPPDIRGQPKHVADPAYIGNPIGSEQLSYPVDSAIIATITKATGTTVGGLNHLEGRSVWLSCPGIAPSGPHVVTSGQVTSPAGWGPTGAVTFKAAVGMAYVCELETLDAAPGTSTQKSVLSVGIEVDSAIGLEAGEDFAHLVPWIQRTVQDSYEYPSAASVLVVVNVKGSWRRTARAVLRQPLPLPVTVLGITRDTDVGGR